MRAFLSRKAYWTGCCGWLDVSLTGVVPTLDALRMDADLYAEDAGENVYVKHTPVEIKIFQCPNCEAYDSEIPELQDVWECDNCGEVYHGKGKELAARCCN